MGDEKRRSDKRRNKLLKWHLECVQRDAQFYVEALERRIRYFTILNGAILLAVVVGYLLVDAWYELILLLVGPLLVLGLNREFPSWDGFARSHALFVDGRARRLRIERTLGLTPSPMTNTHVDSGETSDGPADAPAGSSTRAARASSTDDETDRVVANADRQYVLDLFRLHSLAAYGLIAALIMIAACRMFDLFFRIVPR